MHRIEYAKIGALFAGLGLAAMMAACNDPAVGSFCESPGQCDYQEDSGGSGGKRDAPVLDSASNDSGLSRNPLCGMVGCFPGNISACGNPPLPDAALALVRQDDAAVDTSADQGDAMDGASAPADATSDTSSDTCHEGGHDAEADATVDVTLDAGVPDSAEDTTPDDVTTIDASADGTAPPSGEDASDDGPPSVDGGTIADATIDIGAGDEPHIVQSCYIRPAATTGIVTECAPIGAGDAGSPCGDSLQCGVLMACVETNGRGMCESVSCALPASCMPGKIYRELPLRVGGRTRADILVPVCMPPENCTLLSPTSCPAGKACAVVGTSGETTCIDPGTAMVGESCSETARCAAGLLCSKTSDRCVKLCHVANGDTECPTGTCQGGNLSLPDGFGICVGQAPDGG